MAGDVWSESSGQVREALLPAEDYRARRTFAIISHPDAGKTTLTEQMLHAAGAIRQAGQVQARDGRRAARSDWMEMERTRGISISSSVMTFWHEGLRFNLLDTPGHADFSEDTYRTLTAVDSAIMVLDAAKGIEAQTLKLFEVCRLRNIPIFTFVNKVDRDTLGPLAIIDQIEQRLALDVAPVLWPVGDGVGFRGCLDLTRGRLVLPDGSPGETWASLEALRGRPGYDEALELLRVAQTSGSRFEIESFRAGHLTPVFFGSALKGIGIPELLDAIANWGPQPAPQPAIPTAIHPDEPAVTGFVFKVQANMDANHRDRVAFVRICSGRFERGARLLNTRSNKTLAVNAPMFFMADERQLAEVAVAGDVIGIPNHGTLSVGDTLSEGADLRVTGLPSFAPEIIRRVLGGNALRSKQLGKGLQDLSEEGVAQYFRPSMGGGWYVGVVGMLQLDVLAWRLDKEYGVPVTFEAVGYELARWVEASDPQELQRFLGSFGHAIVLDRFGAPVLLAKDAWNLQRTVTNWPSIRLSATRERG
jgi:peptide chain release factor 3